MKKENYFKIILTSLIFALFIQINLFSQSEITSLSCYNFYSCVYKGYYSKDPQTQIEYYSKALLLWKDVYGIKIKSGIYVNRGSAYQNLKQYDKAISDYNKAIELNPADADAYYGRGLVYYYLKQYNRAIDDYSKAIELNPNFAYAYNNRGITYLWLGKCKKAKSDFDKAIEIGKDKPPSYGNLGIYWWYCNKNKNKSLYYFEKAFQQGFSSQEWNNLYDKTSAGHFIKDLNQTPEFKKLVKKYKNKQTSNQGE